MKLYSVGLTEVVIGVVVALKLCGIVTIGWSKIILCSLGWYLIWFIAAVVLEILKDMN